ncbi:MAG TPA: N-acetylglucosamine kinase [Elusimicrobia bacterium]|nr:N-acetylglucosamine kinase [Elusimicrobiota bacterium]
MERRYRLGIDLGGTKIEGIALDPEGREVFRKRTPTERQKGYTHILENIRRLYRDLVLSIRNRTHTLGMGTPGAISPRTGRLKNSNTVCMNGKPFKADIEELLGRTLEIQNDANCFAMAEALHGAGRGRRMVFGVIMGTGCGGGLVLDGRVWTGRQAIGGEWGHMAIDPRGPECYCGARGCVETFISGGGLERRFEREHGVRRTLKDICAAHARGDPAAGRFMKRFFADFGLCMANLINVLDPDIVVLGGGVSNIDLLYTEGVREAGRRVFNDRLETPIVKHRLGDSAGVLGAALIGV